jgi:hypothetical protein
MRKLILSLLLMLSFQLSVNANGLGFDLDLDPTPGSSNGCPDLSNFDWVNGDINDYINAIQDLQDQYAIGIETHGNIGQNKAMLESSKSGIQMTTALDSTEDQKILVELDPTADRDAIKRLQTYLGLSLMRDTIGEYTRVSDNNNFKICFSSKEKAKHTSLKETIRTIVGNDQAVTAVESCPKNNAKTY